MATGTFLAGLSGLLGVRAWVGDDYRACLIRGNGWAPAALATEATMQAIIDDVHLPNLVKDTAASLAGKLITNGKGYADDDVFVIPAAGALCDYIVVYYRPDAVRVNQIPLTWHGVSVTPNGDDISLHWNSYVISIAG